MCVCVYVCGCMGVWVCVCYICLIVNSITEPSKPNYALYFIEKRVNNCAV